MRPALNASVANDPKRKLVIQPPCARFIYAGRNLPPDNIDVTAQIVQLGLRRLVEIECG